MIEFAGDRVRWVVSFGECAHRAKGDEMTGRFRCGFLKASILAAAISVVCGQVARGQGAASAVGLDARQQLFAAWGAGAPSGDGQFAFDVCQTNASASTTKTKVAKLSRDAQPIAPPDKSVAVTTTSSSVGVLYLADGKGTSATALQVPYYSIAGTGGKLKVCAIGSMSLDGKTQFYAGTGLSYLALSSKGFSLTGVVGWKGLDISSGFHVATGIANLVVGVGLTIPITSI